MIPSRASTALDTVPPPLRGWALGLLGLMMLGGFAHAGWGLRGWNGTAHVGRFLALFGVLCLLYLAAARLCLLLPPGRRGVLGGIFGAAVLFRLALLPAGLDSADRWAAARADLGSDGVGFQRYLLYDQDAWRYLWDGHVLASGLDPYGHSPEGWEDLAYGGDSNAARLLAEPLWEEIFENLAYQEFLTVYPPLAQLFFAALHALAPGSLLCLKGLLILSDLVACWLLLLLLRQLGLRQEGVILYAWNPLVIKEVAGSGHVDGLVVPLLLGALLCVLRGRGRLGLSLLGLSILAKITPALLAPLFLRHTRPRDWPALALTLAVGYLPFITSWGNMLRGLAEFGAGWTFNPGLWLALQRMVEAVAPGRGATVASLFWVAMTLGVVVWLLRLPASVASLPLKAYGALLAFLLFSPTVMPWYLLWALPLAILVDSRAWIHATCLAFLTYLIYIDGVERAWLLVLFHGAVWGLLAIEWCQELGLGNLRRLRRAAGEAPGPLSSPPPGARG